MFEFFRISEFKRLNQIKWSLTSQNFLLGAEEAESEDNRNLKYVQILNFPRENRIMSHQVQQICKVRALRHYTRNTYVICLLTSDKKNISYFALEH